MRCENSVAFDALNVSKPRRERDQKEKHIVGYDGDGKRVQAGRHGLMSHNETSRKTNRGRKNTHREQRSGAAAIDSGRWHRRREQLTPITEVQVVGHR